MGINSTRGFHREIPVDLLKELTVCESLSERTSPYVRALGLEKPYGEILGDFLAEGGLLSACSVLMEVGGGYGSLMDALLSSHGGLIQKVFMADLSPGLLMKQRERLKGHHGKI